MSGKEPIAVLGMGAMGSRMALNFANAGHEVTVWNRTAETARELADVHGFSVATTPREAVNGAAVVVSMVADDEAATAVWLDPENGAMSAMSSSAVGIESSTLTPATVRQLAAEAIERGLTMLEAPVVGSRPQADAGGLFYVVGGDASVLEEVRSVLEVNAGGIRLVGPMGSAAIMKLAINGLFGIQVAAYGEIAGFLERSDIDTDTAFGILASLPITSPALQRIVGLFGDRQFDPNFPIPLVSKDFRYLGEAAAGLGAEVPVSKTAGTVYASMAAGNYGNLDIAGVAMRYLAP